MVQKAFFQLFSVRNNRNVEKHSFELYYGMTD